MKVIKFGGSSLSDGEKIKHVKKLIMSDAERRYIVVSAPGKRNGGDIKITDLLLECYAGKEAGEDYGRTLSIIKARYDGICSELGVRLDTEREFEYIYRSIGNGCGYDYILSRGEYLNAKIIAEFLGFCFIDAENCIFFDKNGDIDFQKTTEMLKKISAENHYAVFPGFYGRDSDGNIKVFSRGGSDVTGAIIASALSAEMYENWTDVNGCLSAPPTIVSDAGTIDFLTYYEMRELSHTGATILHEDTVFPLTRKEIPINIRNTENPDNHGTVILPARRKNRFFGISALKKCSISTSEKNLASDTFSIEFAPTENFVIRRAENGSLSIVVVVSDLSYRNYVRVMQALEEKRIVPLFSEYQHISNTFYAVIQTEELNCACNIIYSVIAHSSCK